jgi:hypothetical protein
MGPCDRFRRSLPIAVALLSLAYSATAAPTPRPRPGNRDYIYAILQRDFEGAKAALDARLTAGQQIALPMARERSGGVDNWMLIIAPDKIAVTENMGKLHSDAPITETKVEGPGMAKAAPAAADHTPGFFVRLKLAKKTYNLYFWPPASATCHEEPRFLSLNTFLQCDEPGSAMQGFVADWVAQTLMARGAKGK